VRIPPLDVAGGGAARFRAAAGPLLVAAAVLAVHAACWDRHGLFRDELYFLACGQRLGLGYVDQPPGVALVARLAQGAFGLWVPGLRLLPWVASALLALLAAGLARRLGGGAFAATLAAAAVAAAPVALGLGHYLTMNAFEPLLWTALALALLRAVATDGARGGVLAGLAAGAGVLFKYSAAPWAAFLVLGLLATPSRTVLVRRGLLAGALLAAALVLPNLLWQAAHGFPFLELVRNGQLRKNVPFALGAFAGEVVLAAHPLALPLWAGGLAWLLAARRARPHRFLGVAAALELLFLVATKAKAYYAAPLLPVLFAAGAVAAEGWLRPRPLRAAALALLAVTGLALAPVALPLAGPEAIARYLARAHLMPPPTERHRMGALPQIHADQFGWPELAQAVAEVARALPPAERARAAVFARNYGEAAAVELLGAPLGAPPVASGHNHYFLWGPPPGRGEVLIVVGDERETCDGYGRKELARRLPEHPWAMPYESGLWLWICREPLRPLAELWPAVKNYI
jgi:hypothetical protein